MKTFGQAVAIGGLLLTFAGCDFNADDDDTINIQTAPDGGLLDALPSSDDGGIHCRALGKLGAPCFPLQ